MVQPFHPLAYFSRDTMKGKDSMPYYITFVSPNKVSPSAALFKKSDVVITPLKTTALE
jgi:hypothetical protein